MLAGLALCVTLAACSGEPEPEAEAARTHTPLTIAFAGDVHFAGVLADRLSDPSTAMGPLTSVLAAADIGVLNLETAVTTRGAPRQAVHLPVAAGRLRRAAASPASTS